MLNKNKTTIKQYNLFIYTRAIRLIAYFISLFASIGLEVGAQMHPPVQMQIQQAPALKY